jgi:hypothetical protein
MSEITKQKAQHPLRMKDVHKPKEKNLHTQVCQYLKMQYPKILFNSDAAGVRLTMGQAIQMKKLRAGNGYPDLMIFEPRGDFYGLFIELKREGERIWLKDNSPSTDDHIREQLGVLKQLNERHYFAVFAIGFDEAKTTIDEYLKLK